VKTLKGFVCCRLAQLFLSPLRTQIAFASKNINKWWDQRLVCSRCHKNCIRSQEIRPCQSQGFYIQCRPTCFLPLVTIPNREVLVNRMRSKNLSFWACRWTLTSICRALHILSTQCYVLSKGCFFLLNSAPGNIIQLNVWIWTFNAIFRKGKYQMTDKV
jgi:hypothetical protein